MTRMHQWDQINAKRATGLAPSSRWKVAARIVTLVVILLLMVGVLGHGWSVQSKAEIERQNWGFLLAVGSLIALNVTVFLGTRRRWPHVTPAAIVWLLIIGVSVYLFGS
jgi:hypothetical protein